MRLPSALSKRAWLLAWLLWPMACDEGPLPGASEDASAPGDGEDITRGDTAVPRTPDSPLPVDSAPLEAIDVALAPPDAVADTALVAMAEPDASPVDLWTSGDLSVDGPVGPTDAPPCRVYTSDCRGARCEVPLDWNEALTGLPWANAIMYFGYSVVLCHTGRGYDQAIGSQRVPIGSLSGPSEIRDIYLYDAITGKFVQRIHVGDPATQSVGCVLRAADAPEVAITDTPLPCERIVRGSKEDADVADF